MGSRGLTLILVGATALSLALFWPQLSFYMLTKRTTPIHIVERLTNEVSVAQWTSNAFLLADGRTIEIPHVSHLPPESLALSQLTQRGVEVARDGQVYALVRVHHWCGNDPVKDHIARVNVSDALAFLRIGSSSDTLESESAVLRDGGSFSQWGWRVGEYNSFRSWQQLRQMTRDEETSHPASK
jgi:hypothetical protein